MSRVLIVEDEAHLANGLRFNLEAEGYEVTVVETGEEALSLLMGETGNFNLLILDVMLPGKDGFSVMSELRQAGHYIPTLMLTARGHADDILRGFSSGADDYLPKPFELKILLARLRGLLRRHKWIHGEAERESVPNEARPGEAQPEVFRFSGKQVDFDRLEIHVGGKVFPLTLMEANLLRYLIRNEGKAVSRKNMLADVWELRENTDTRAIDNFIVRLRRYIEDNPGSPKHLLTVRGIGYRFIATPA